MTNTPESDRARRAAIAASVSSRPTLTADSDPVSGAQTSTPGGIVPVRGFLRLDVRGKAEEVKASERHMPAELVAAADQANAPHVDAKPDLQRTSPFTSNADPVNTALLHQQLSANVGTPFYDAMINNLADNPAVSAGHINDVLWKFGTMPYADKAAGVNELRAHGQALAEFRRANPSSSI